MDINAVRKALEAFAHRHRVTFRQLGARQTQVLELGALVGAAQHFKSVGFELAFHNAAGKKRFRIKSSTRGHPCDYSRVICRKGEVVYELHANLTARGAHDLGVYCVDVGVVRAGVIPLERPPGKWVAIDNAGLISFVEAKKLVVYPMLLAQFLGIVHEIRPEFLRTPAPAGFGSDAVIPPSLVALGRYSSNSNVIIDGFLHRGFSFLVVPLFDFQLARCRLSPDQSPFYQPEEETAVGLSATSADEASPFATD